MLFFMSQIFSAYSGDFFSDYKMEIFAIQQ